MSCRIETIDDNLIIWVTEDTPYVYTNIHLQEMSTKLDGNSGDMEDITLRLVGKTESKNGTIKMKFNDGQHTIDINKYVVVRKDYGQLEEMSFTEFKERLLVLEL